ncbi:MAG TPA: thioesterase family protein [Candidatus Limnocylindria bacterium]|nr:thioesterase family protein [Candidatus Limnocylindria bacterium]
MIDEFRHRTRLEVRLGDLDPFGHVNNAVIATYVEQGRVLYLRDVLGTGVDPVSMPFILAMLKIDYLSQVLFSDAVEVGSRVDWIGRTSIGMSHLLINQEARELARSEAVLVAFDYDIEKPMPVSEGWRATMVAHEGRPLARPVTPA